VKLAGHHAVVTGGGTGIGAAIARTLAAEGAKLTLVGRRREKLEEVGASCSPAKAGVQPGAETRSRTSPGHLIAPADVTVREEVDRAFALARETQGPITILVNNAGAAESAPFDKVTDEIWRRTMAVNLDALLHCTQAALPDLLNAQAGRIVTIASVAGLKGYAYASHYVAAKHGAVGLTRALAAEYARTSLTVNAVCPGYTETAMVEDAVANIRDKTGRSEEEARDALARFNPQGRLVMPQEVAAAVLWLCLPESGSINGQAIAVAGGEVM
jgi:NAD(P)-dependent dehydrogenase (short-subunit alcohol dehydrogenase family)